MSNYIDKIKKDGVEYDIHASNGGSQLYKHEVVVGSGYTSRKYCIINNSSEPLDTQSKLNLAIRATDAISKCVADYAGTSYTANAPIISCDAYDGASSTSTYYYCKSNGTIASVTLQSSITATTDTVTAL